MFAKFDSHEKSIHLLIEQMKNFGETMITSETSMNPPPFAKFYSKLTVIHDKELYLALKSKESYFTLLYRCFDEVKSIYMLNYNRRLALSVQIEALRLAVKSKR